MSLTVAEQSYDSGVIQGRVPPTREERALVVYGVGVTLLPYVSPPSKPDLSSVVKECEAAVCSPLSPAVIRGPSSVSLSTT